MAIVGGYPGRPTSADLRFELRAPRLGLVVDVSLSEHRDRWVARTLIGDRRAAAIGRSPREAVVSVLVGLGPAAVSELLADLSLLDVSRQLYEAAASAM
jgi:hypothetical protein